MVLFPIHWPLGIDLFSQQREMFGRVLWLPDLHGDKTFPVYSRLGEGLPLSAIIAGYITMALALCGDCGSHPPHGARQKCSLASFALSEDSRRRIIGQRKCERKNFSPSAESFQRNKQQSLRGSGVGWKAVTGQKVRCITAGVTFKSFGPNLNSSSVQLQSELTICSELFKTINRRNMWP